MTPHQQKDIVARLVTAQIQKDADRIRRETAQQMYAVILTVLHDKWDFKANDLIKVFEQCTSQFDCLNGKYIKMEDFYELLGEMGIKVK